MKHEDFDDFCYNCSKNYKFNLAMNNCQNWCKEVVNQLPTTQLTIDKNFKFDECDLYSIRLSSQLSQLSLIKYAQTNSLQNQFSHWALLLDLPYLSSSDRNKKVYHIHKTSIVNGVGNYESFTFHENSNKILEIIEIGQLHMTHDQFDEFCKEYSKNYNFNLPMNNCQNWCKYVVNQLTTTQLTKDEKFNFDKCSPTNECYCLYSIRLSSQLSSNIV